MAKTPKLAPSITEDSQTMPITITRDQLAAMEPCDLTERLALFGKRKTLNVAQALKAGATVRDVLWVAGQLGLRDQIVTFANGCAAYAATARAATARAATARAATARAADAARQAEIDQQHAHLIELF